MLTVEIQKAAQARTRIHVFPSTDLSRSQLTASLFIRVCIYIYKSPHRDGKKPIDVARNEEIKDIFAKGGKAKKARSLI